MDEPLEKDSGRGPDDHSDLAKLVTAAKESDWKKRLAQLDRVLDLDEFFTFMAMEVMAWHWDGYLMHKNNYRLYFDPTPQRFVFLPHGMDQMFFTTNGPVLPFQEGLVAKAVLEPEEENGNICFDSRNSTTSSTTFHLWSSAWMNSMPKFVRFFSNLAPELAQYNKAVSTLKGKISDRSACLEQELSRIRLSTAAGR